MKRSTVPTAKQQIFIETFDVEAEDWVEEAYLAGKRARYCRKESIEMMSKPKIVRALKHREEYGMSEEERNRKLRIEFWETVMGDRAVEMKDRLRASELWGKHEGDFVHRVDANVKVAKDLEEKLGKALEDDSGSD